MCVCVHMCPAHKHGMNTPSAEIQRVFRRTASTTQPSGANDGYKWKERESCSGAGARRTGPLPESAGGRRVKKSGGEKEAHGDGGKSNLHSLSLQSHSGDAALCREAEVRRVPSRYATRLPGSLHKVQDCTRARCKVCSSPKMRRRRKERRGCELVRCAKKTIVCGRSLSLIHSRSFSVPIIRIW